MKKTIFLLDHLLARRACLWPALVVLSALALGPPPAQAAVTEAWVHRYSNVVSNSNDQAVKVVRDAAGDIIVTGFTDDRIQGPEMLTIKYSGADGSVLWQQRYKSPANYNYGTALAVDGSGNVVVTGYSATVKYAAADGALLWEQRSNDRYPAAVAVDGSDNVVVTKSSYNLTNRSDDYYTAKYAAATGALLWEQRYNRPANSAATVYAVAVDGSGDVVVTGSSATIKYLANGTGVWTNNGGATALAVDGSGDVLVTGSSYNGTNNDYYTAKYASADGALLWEKRYNGPTNSSDEAMAVAVDGSGNVVVTGSSGYSVFGGNPDYYTAKYAAADGALLWEKRYNGLANSDDRARAVAVDGGGNVLVTGSSWNGTNSDYYTAKYAAADGALLWEKRYNGLANGSDEASAVIVDGSGNVVVTGSSGTGSFYYYPGDYYTAKYAAANGAMLWEQRYNGLSSGSDVAEAVAVDGSGNVVVTGTSYNTNYTNPDYYTAKYAAGDGALLWEKRYNGLANGDDQANALAVDGSGNVVVTGGSSNGTNYDYYTAKYAGADGALLWEKRYNGPENQDDYATAVAVDGSGNVVVTGYAGFVFRGVIKNSDYYTAKYAAADGALLWEKRYSAPANGEDVATAVAVDGSGNVVVTGYSVDGSLYDYYTAKYAAADGALFWEKRYDGPANSYDFAYALAVDSSGNVVVTGSSIGTNSYDYYTAKYAAADGALLWEKRYNGPAFGSDEAFAVAVDGSDNVVVTGASVSVNNFDYYTAKYAAADGAILWDKRYDNGSANLDDDSYGAHSLALGPNGMVAITGASSRDYATVVYRDDVYPISIALIPAGVRLRFTGIPSRSYTIERAPAVTGPWTPINTQTAPASGLLEYIDAPPPPGSAFYRTVQP